MIVVMEITEQIRLGLVKAKNDMANMCTWPLGVGSVSELAHEFLWQEQPEEAAEEAEGGRGRKIRYGRADSLNMKVDAGGAHPHDVRSGC